MKTEVRCPSCGRGYLVDEARIPAQGASAACKACGGIIVIAARPSASAQGAGRAAAAGPSPSAARPPAGRPAAPIEARRPAPAGGHAASRSDEAVCPRCGLHFVPRRGPVAEPSEGRRTVLVVEDMSYFQEVAADALSGKYEVKTAHNLEQARDALAAGGIHLILLGLDPESGEDRLSLLREMPVKPCPVLIYTAQDESEMYGESWAKLQALGADDLVLKGIQAGEMLLRKVDALLDTPP